ncbi:MAG TPA: CbiX/SirB N-terminal domain-containing protein [Planctomicrobium sp.]|nr:CbiX/SirB N-terminal domain-containing protein [Planctomicrobium sp.]
MTSAILLIAHGSRRAEANAELVTVAEQLRPLVAPAIVEVSYLEVVGPTIPEGLEKCVSLGAESIRILPYFLSPGAHVVDDLEQARQDFQTRHPDIPCRLCPPLGRHPKLLEILVDHSQEEF